METNINRAKEIRAPLPANAAAAQAPLRLTLGAPGELPKLLGERVAVNARQAAILVEFRNRAVQIGSGEATVTSAGNSAGVRLFAWHVSALSPRVELEWVVSGRRDASETTVFTCDPDPLEAREEKLLNERRVLPVVALPEYAGLGQNVRDRMPARRGEWHLADVWLNFPVPSPAQVDTSNSAGTPLHPARAPLPGAKP